MTPARLLAIVISTIATIPAPAWAAEPPAPAKPTPAWLHERGWPSVRADVGVTVGWGVAQRVAVGTTLNMVLRWQLIDRPIDAVSVLYSLRWDPPAGGRQSHGRQVTTDRLLAMLDPCVHRWQLYACVAIGGGRLGIDSKGWTPGGSHDYGPAIAVMGGRFGVDVPFTPHVGLRVSGELLGLINPVTIPVDDLHQWTTPRVSGGIELGVYVSPSGR